MARVIGIMNKLKHIFPHQILRTLYNSLIHTHLIYGLYIWGFFPKRLTILQKKAVRILARSPDIYQGRPQDLGGGGPRNFFSDLGICMSRSDMLRMAKPCALLGGFGGMLPRENFLKRCNLVRFRVYFDQILSLFFSKKYHFLYKK